MINGSENDCIYLPERGHKYSHRPQVKYGIKKASEDLKPAYHLREGKEGWELRRGLRWQVAPVVSWPRERLLNVCLSRSCFVLQLVEVLDCTVCLSLVVTLRPQDLPAFSGVGQSQELPSHPFLFPSLTCSTRLKIKYVDDQRRVETATLERWIMGKVPCKHENLSSNLETSESWAFPG